MRHEGPRRPGERVAVVRERQQGAQPRRGVQRRHAAQHDDEAARAARRTGFMLFGALGIGMRDRRPRQAGAVQARGIVGGEHHRLGARGGVVRLVCAQHVDGLARGELRGAEPLHERAAQHLARVLHLTQHGKQRAQPAGHARQLHHVARQHAVAIEDRLHQRDSAHRVVLRRRHDERPPPRQSRTHRGLRRHDAPHRRRIDGAHGGPAAAHAPTRRAARLARSSARAFERGAHGRVRVVRRAPVPHELAHDHRHGRLVDELGRKPSARRIDDLAEEQAAPEPERLHHGRLDRRRRRTFRLRPVGRRIGQIGAYGRERRIGGIERDEACGFALAGAARPRRPPMSIALVAFAASARPHHVA